MRALLLPLILAAGTAHAQYKCVAPGGAVSLQQLPCAADARSERLRVAPPEPERPEYVRRALARGRVAIGMTRAEVERSAGRKPDAVNVTILPGGIEHQLVYRSRITTYVYLRDGIVTSIGGDE